MPPTRGVEPQNVHGKPAIERTYIHTAYRKNDPCTEYSMAACPKKHLYFEEVYLKEEE